MLYEDDLLTDMADEANVSTTMEALIPALPLSPQNAEALRQTVLKCAASVTNKRAEIAALEAEEKRLAGRRERLERRIEETESWLLRLLETAGLDRVKDHRFTISVRPCPPAVEIADRSLLPAQYMHPPPATAPAPDKRAILAALERGENVPGCAVVRRTRVEIR